MKDELQSKEQFLEALKATEHKYGALFNNTNDGIFLHELTEDGRPGKFVEVNDRACKMTGYSRDELLALTPLDIDETPPDAVKTIVQEMLSKGLVVFETIMITKNKDKIPIEISNRIFLVNGKRTVSSIVRDITARKQADEKIRESEERLRQAVRVSQSGIFDHDHLTDTIYWSPLQREIYGWGPDETVTLQAFLDCVYPEERERIAAAVRRAHDPAGDGIFDVEHRVIRRDGAVRWVTTRCQTFFDGEGGARRKVRTIGATLDITGRKQAEEAKDRLLKAIAAVTDGIAITDDKDRFTYVNDAHARIYGYPREELIGKTWRDFVSPDLEPLLERDIAKTLHNRAVGTWSGEGAAIRKDGTVLPTEIVATARWDEAGNYLGHICIVRDISERRRAEEERNKMEDALQASEKRYRMLFESSGDAIFILEAEGDNTGKIIAANKAAASMHGYPIDELLTLSIRDLHPPETARESPSQIDPILKGEWINIESTHRKKDGTIFPIEFSAGLLDLGNHKYILAFDRDITDRRHMEEQLRHAQKMEALGTLTGGIAHEFNNILQSIIGYGEMLDDALKDNPLSTYSNVILSSAQRASSITRGLLAYSRKQIVDRKLISLNEIIKKVEGLLSRFIGEDIDLRLVLADSNLIVNVDSNQIEQVLINLATNAKDAMPNGGVLTISTEHTAVDDKFIQAHGYGEPGEYALICVKDTGIGMDEKTKGRIFEPFFTTKGMGKGTGLGLSIVYGIVKTHNGYIAVQSAPGEGTTFNIYIPAIKMDIERVQSAAGPVRVGGSETVLVAEDDTEVRRLINTLLENAGYKVIEAVDGEDAIEKMRENKDRIQLLLCDVVMPKKNGREVFDEIIKMKPNIKALFISGYTDDIIHEKGILAEGLNFISKPILPRELLRKVRDVLDK